MRTTLNIPDALINDLVIETGEKNKSRLMKTALEEMLRTIRRKRLISMSGNIDLDITEDELAADRALDMI